MNAFIEFTDFASEIILYISIYLPSFDILKLSQTCKKLHELLKDDYLWKQKGEEFLIYTFGKEECYKQQIKNSIFTTRIERALLNNFYWAELPVGLIVKSTIDTIVNQRLTNKMIALPRRTGRTWLLMYMMLMDALIGHGRRILCSATGLRSMNKLKGTVMVMAGSSKIVVEQIEYGLLINKNRIDFMPLDSFDISHYDRIYVDESDGISDSCKKVLLRKHKKSIAIMTHGLFQLDVYDIVTILTTNPGVSSSPGVLVGCAELLTENRLNEILESINNHRNDL
jgi:hypothetical protein